MFQYIALILYPLNSYLSWTLTFNSLIDTLNDYEICIFYGDKNTYSSERFWEVSKSNLITIIFELVNESTLTLISMSFESKKNYHD